MKEGNLEHSTNMLQNQFFAFHKEIYFKILIFLVQTLHTIFINHVLNLNSHSGQVNCT